MLLSGWPCSYSSIAFLHEHCIRLSLVEICFLLNQVSLNMQNTHVGLSHKDRCVQSVSRCVFDKQEEADNMQETIKREYYSHCTKKFFCCHRILLTIIKH